MRGQILIIDDNPMDIQIVTLALNASGWACFGFTDHAQALEWLNENTPQLIFLDLQMPKITGYQLIPILRKIPKAAKVPIIIVSGKNESDDIMKAIKLGAVDYIVKPLDPLVLQEKVAKSDEQNETEFHALILAPEDQAVAYLAKPVRVLALSEFGTRIVSEVRVTPGETLDLNGLPAALFGKEQMMMRCLSSELAPNQKDYVMQMTFVGVTESQRQFIRKACRQKWIQAKAVS